MALRVGKENFELEVIKAQVPVIVEFYSDSCVPCKQMAVVLGELEDEYDDKVKIVKVNVQFNPELTQEHKIMAAPTFLFFYSEKEVKRMVGITKKAILQEIVDELIG